MMVEWFRMPLFFLMAVLIPASSYADDVDLERRVRDLENEVGDLKHDVQGFKRYLWTLELDLARYRKDTVLLVLFLFGFVFARWAQDTGRSRLVWFILGFIPGVNLIAGFVLLSMGPEARRRGLL